METEFIDWNLWKIYLQEIEFFFELLNDFFYVNYGQSERKSDGKSICESEWIQQLIQINECSEYG